VNELTSDGRERLRQARLSLEHKKQKKTKLCPVKAERGAERAKSNIVDTFIGFLVLDVLIKKGGAIMVNFCKKSNLLA